VGVTLGTWVEGVPVMVGLDVGIVVGVGTGDPVGVAVALITSNDNSFERPLSAPDAL
jgi:hypothetical protein